jgi:hypothetical protein
MHCKACTLCACAAVVALSNAAHSIPLIWKEDFTDPITGDAAFDPNFNHNLYEITPNSFFWDLDVFSGANALILAPAGDAVTFNTAPGTFVDFAEVTFIDFCGVGCTTVEFLGTMGSFLYANQTVGMAETISTVGLGLGEITQINLESFEGVFTNILVQVVPAPSVAALAALGLACIARRRR